MTKIFRYLAIGIVCWLLAGVSAIYGFFEWKMAKAVESSVVFDFESPGKIYGELERRFAYLNKIPYVFDQWHKEIAIKNAEIEYWKQDYLSLTMSDDKLAEQIPQVSFIRANAEYRSIETEKNRKLVIEGLERAINGYLQTIKDESGHFDVAFNYEYLFRLRNETAKSKKLPLSLKSQADNKKDGSGQQESQPGKGEGMHGKEGSQVTDSAETKIKIHIPLESDEAKEKGGKEAGKGDAQRKKG